MKVTVNGLDVTLRVDYRDLTPRDSAITEIATASFIVEDAAKTLTALQVPQVWHEVVVYDDDDTTVIFGGYVYALEELPLHPVGRAWRLDCRGYQARMMETATGSLNEVGVIDTDRNFVIAIFRDALQSQSYGGTTIDDAIITANEAAGWSGVEFTAFMSGLDWSYMTPANAIDNLMRYVPNVVCRIGADRLVTYGIPRTLAPFAVSSSPNGTTLRAFEDFRHETTVSDHRNKMRRGGADASEVTAIDEVSWSRFGRILDSPYKNDTNVPAADLERRTYAELRAKRIQHRAMFVVRDKGLEAGTVIDVVNARVGAGTLPAPLCTNLLIARSASGEIAGEVGRMVITKVRTLPTGNRTYAYEVEAGDLVKDFPLTLPGEET